MIILNNFIIKTTIIFSLILILSSYFITCLCFENEEEENYEISSLLSSLETSTTASKEPSTSSSHIIAIDRNSLRVLFEKNAYSQTPMASTTKILTAIITLEQCKMQDLVTISNKAASTTGSVLGITSNTQMTIKDLLYGLMLRSGNDCAVALAEHIGGNTDNFSNIMNNKAKELGLINSNFVTPHGLDHPNHYTTAYELAILTNYALNNKEFLKIVSTKTSTVNCGNLTKTISNTNELLGNYEGVYGVKTGFTFGAGRCLVSACKKNDLDIIVVVLGADTKKTRTSDSIKVLNYVYSNYANYDIQNIIYDNFKQFETYFKNNITIEKTTDIAALELSTPKNTFFPLSTNEVSNINLKIFTLTKLNAPLLANQKIGTLNVSVNDEILLSLDILLKNSLSKKTWKIYYFELLQNFFAI